MMNIQSSSISPPLSSPPPPQTIAEWLALSTLTVVELRQRGLKSWSEETRLMLFPHSGYDAIPTGLSIVTIRGEEKLFKLGVTDDDQRFGCLAFGVVAIAAPFGGSIMPDDFTPETQKRAS